MRHRIIGLSLLAVLAFAPRGEAVIGYDNAQVISASAASFNWAHTIAGSDRAILVYVAIQNDDATSPVTAVRYNGVDMTMKFRAFIAFQLVLEGWYLVAPATGANNVTVELDASHKMTCGSISLTGVHQSDPVPTSNSFITDTAGSGPVTISITTANDDSWLADCAFLSSLTIPATNSGQTSRWSGNTTGMSDASNSAGRGSTKSVGTAGSYDSSYTWGVNKKHALGVMEIRQSAAAPTPTETPDYTDTFTLSPTFSETFTLSYTPSHTPTPVARCMDAKMDTVGAAGVTVTSASMVDTAIETSYTISELCSVAVFASFSSISTNNPGTPRTGTWDLQLDASATVSQPIDRYMDGSTDRGSAGIFYIFENVTAAAHTFKLRHSSGSASDAIATADANLVTFPLLIDGTILNSDVDKLDSAGVTTASTSFVDITGFSATVTLPVKGEIFVAVSINCTTESGAGSRTATYDIEVDGTTITQDVPRWLADTSDVGAVVIVGTSAEMLAGTYTVTVRHKVDDGTLKSYNGNLIAMATSDDFRGGVNYHAHQVTDAAGRTTNATSLTDIFGSGQRPNVDVAENDRILMVSSYTSEFSGGAADRVISHDLQHTLPDTTISETMRRMLSGSGDVGSQVSVGLSAPVTAGTYEGQLRHATDNGSNAVKTSNITLVMFDTCYDFIVWEVPMQPGLYQSPMME